MLFVKFNGYCFEVALAEAALSEVALLGPKSLINSFSIVEYTFLSDNSNFSFGNLSLVYT